MEHLNLIKIVGTATVTAGKFRRGEVGDEDVRRVSSQLIRELMALGPMFESTYFAFSYDRGQFGAGRIECNEIASELILNYDSHQIRLDLNGSMGAAISIEDHLYLLDDAPFILRYLIPLIKGSKPNPIAVREE